MKPHEIAIRIAQRFLYGYLHHSQMASFFDLLKMGITADNQRKSAFEDAKKREKMDEIISYDMEQIPLYTVSNVDTIVKDLANVSYETIKNNKKAWLEKGIKALANYEKDTMKLLDNCLNEAKQIKDEKLVRDIEKFIEEVKEELDNIEHFYNELQKHEFDYERFKKEKKGDATMRYDDRYYDDRYDDDRYEEERRRKMMDDERYEPMGFADRREYDDYWYPFFMEARRGVPGTGRVRYRRRYR